MSGCRNSRRGEQVVNKLEFKIPTAQYDGWLHSYEAQRTRFANNPLLYREMRLFFWVGWGLVFPVVCCFQMIGHTILVDVRRREIGGRTGERAPQVTEWIWMGEPVLTFLQSYLGKNTKSRRSYRWNLKGYWPARECKHEWR